VRLPDAPYLHVFVTRGSIEREATGPLAAGDAARITAGGGQRIDAIQPSEVLVWEIHAALIP